MSVLDAPAQELVPSEDAEALASLLAELDERTWAGDDAPLGSGRIVTVADRLIQGGL